MTLEIQFATMGTMLLGGLSLGGLFDLYRVLAHHLKASRYAYYLLDIVFWIIGTLLVFKLLYDINWGQVRLFIFIGLLAGVIVYFWLFSGLIIHCLHFLIRMVKIVFQWVVKLVNILIITPVVLLFRVILIFFGFLSAIAIFLYQVMIQLLYTVWKLIRFLTFPLTRYVRAQLGKNTTVQTMVKFIRRFFHRT
ncbi:spore cortex biosynthesis protein YabQ [Paenibacillus sp. 1_12]|uniref:spore cortex biosynthesis protein YabQ n=1 Tax=Paenibacillus sp. 1_12 TaxID=1566278 RepID=UPI0008E6E777|nr:spore cortex biosynthesis protein YabQ [Paenibacillus sp. 1_12]SFM31719.1 spore cortex biosynthesis protein YabQ [Paenibacillus sp. 1_12]